MVKKATSKKSLQNILTDNISSLFQTEAREIVEILEEKGYIDVEQPKFNIIVPQAFRVQDLDKDIYSKKLGFVSFSNYKTDKEEYQFTQDEIDNNQVLKQLEPFKVEVK